MREIEFRVWHQEEQKMYYVQKVNYFGGTGFYDPYVGCENGVWMQFTGLQDRSGTGIYEGDFIHDKEFDNGIGEVYFDSEIGVWKVGFKEEDWLYEYHDCSEVIGNRFDNPDLLGEVKGNG